MPLRLRRGTNAERQLVTPLEGELIYVTDYEIRNVSPIWVGDGFTPGGNPIDSSSGAFGLNALVDVDISTVPPQIGDTLKWNGSVFVPQPDIDTQGEGVVEGGNYSINIVGSDSSLIIDSVNNLVTGNIDNFETKTEELFQVKNGSFAISNFLREEISPITDPAIEISKHNHGVRVNGVDTVLWAMSFSENQHIILPRPDGIPNFQKFVKIWSNGKVMINGAGGVSGFEDLEREPDSQLDIYGVMKLTPQTAEPATPVEGMIAVADGVNWDPALVGTNTSYPVYFNGTSWSKMI